MTWLIEILLPVGPRRKSAHARVRAELLDRFGGLTVWSRAPARGLWKPGAAAPEADDIVVYEVLAPDLDRRWWKTYRGRLEDRFLQASVVVRARRVTLL